MPRMIKAVYTHVSTHPDSPKGEWWGGLEGAILGEKKFVSKCFSGKIKHFKTIF